MARAAPVRCVSYAPLLPVRWFESGPERGKICYDRYVREERLARSVAIHVGKTVPVDVKAMRDIDREKDQPAQGQREASTNPKKRQQHEESCVQAF